MSEAARRQQDPMSDADGCYEEWRGHEPAPNMLNAKANSWAIIQIVSERSRGYAEAHQQPKLYRNIAS